MEDQQQQPQVRTFDPEGLTAFYAEFGRLAHEHHDLLARHARLTRTSQTLMELHAPGRCVPAGADDAGADPTPIQARRKGG